MAYNPHLRLSLIGTLPSEEMFTISVSLLPNDSLYGSTWQSWFTGMNDSLFDDLVADSEQFWGRTATGISSRAVLKRVKLASLDAQGHYTASPKEAAVNRTGGWLQGQLDMSDMLPHQVARKVTLETDGDLGRIKGGFYLPGVRQYGFDPGSNLTSVEVTEGVRGSVKTFLDAIENSPGLDEEGFRVVIASQGRRDLNGAIRVAAGNHEVKRVNVGRRVDVQRRRANKISEARIADVTLADGS